MRSRKLSILCAVIMMIFCGTAWAKVADDMTMSGKFTQGYTVNTWYSSGVTVSGGVTDYTFNITSGALPPGFFIRQNNNTFYLEGVPDTAGTWTFSLRVTDRRDCYVEREFTFTVSDEHYEANDMSLSGVFTGSAEAGTWYQSYVQVIGGTSAYTFNVTGTLPEGLYIRQDGSRFYLEGVPTKAGDSTFTLKVTDRRNSYTEKSISVSVTGSYTAPAKSDNMQITEVFETGRKINERYYSDVYLNNYEGSVRWSVVNGELPPGLSLNPENWYACLDGIPNTAGTYTFTLRAIDSRNVYADCQFTVKINGTPYESDEMSMTEVFATGRKINESYYSYIYLHECTSPTRWSVVSGTLPPGLSLTTSDGTARLHGIPNTAGTYTFTLRANDSRNAYVEHEFTVKINDIEPYEADDMMITEVFATNRKINEDYYSYVQVQGNDGTTRWSVVSGTLPPGLSLETSNYEAYLRGIPNTAGTYTFTLRAVDGRNAYAEHKFTVKINDTPYEADDMSITGIFATDKAVNEWYDSYAYLQNYASPTRWLVVNGTLPPGLSLSTGDSYAELRGIPNTPGTYFFTLRANDSRNAYVDRNFSITITGEASSAPTQANDMSFNGTFSTGYTVNTWYSSYVYVDGGTEDYTFAISGGSLPPGFFINQSGNYFYLEGVPDQAGTYSFTLRVIDQRNQYTEREFTVKINGEHYEASDMSITGKFPEAYTINPWYSSNVQVYGGTEDYTFAVSDGALPPGFFIRQSGRDFYLEGVPSTPGTYNFTLKITDRRNAYTEKSLTMTINGSESTPDPITITTSSLRDAGAGETYSQTLQADSNVTSWKITSGSLPSGLTLSETTGTISGTVASNAVEHNAEWGKAYTFEVTASNASGASATKSLSITVYEPITIITESLPKAKVGEAYSVTVEASGTDAYTWVLRPAADVPSWLKYGSNENTCTLSGTPTTAGSYSFTIECGSIYSAGDKKFTLTVESNGGGGGSDTGTEEDEVVTPKPKFKKANLTLSGQIAVNFFIELPEISGVDYNDGKTCYTGFDINGDTSGNNPQPVDGEFMEDGYHGFKCYVTSVQMADPITATFNYAGNTVQQEYSVKRYLDNMLNKSTTSATMKDLAAAIKNYGHYAQIYLARVNGWTLGEKHIAIESASDYTTSDIESVKSLAAPYKIAADSFDGSGIKSASYSLNLDADTTINLTFKMDSSYTGTLSAYLNGGNANVAVKQSDGSYKVQITGISAHKLADTQTVKIYAGKELTVKASGLTFVYTSMYGSNMPEDRQKAAVALYRYYEKTIAYRNAK